MSGCRKVDYLFVASKDYLFFAWLAEPPDLKLHQRDCDYLNAFVQDVGSQALLSRRLLPAVCYTRVVRQIV